MLELFHQTYRDLGRVELTGAPGLLSQSRTIRPERDREPATDLRSPSQIRDHAERRPLRTSGGLEDLPLDHSVGSCNDCRSAARLHAAK